MNSTHKPLTETMEAIEGYTFIYVSIPFFNHRVFKCAGQVPDSQLKFYAQRFADGVEGVSAHGSEHKTVLTMKTAPAADRFSFSVADQTAPAHKSLTYRQSGIAWVSAETLNHATFAVFNQQLEVL